MSKLTIVAFLLVLGVCLSQAAPTDNLESREKRSPEPHRNKEVIKVKVYERTPHGLVKHKYKFKNYGRGFGAPQPAVLGLGGYGNAAASSHATSFSHSGPFGSISHSSASAVANSGSSFF